MPNFSKIGQSAAELLSVISMYTADCSHWKRVHNGRVTTSVQLTALYTVADLVIALKHCYQKAQENAKNPNFQPWALSTMLDFIRSGL